MRSPYQSLARNSIGSWVPCALRFRYANVGYTFPVGITQAITANQEQRQSNFRTELASIPDSKSEGV